MLYRKRESASGTHERSVLARFRYNDLKEDAGGCGGCGLRAGPGLTAMGIDAESSITVLIFTRNCDHPRRKHSTECGLITQSSRLVAGELIDVGQNSKVPICDLKGLFFFVGLKSYLPVR